MGVEVGERECGDRGQTGVFPTHQVGVCSLHLQSSLWIIMLTANPCSFFLGPNPSHPTQHLICLCKNLHKAGSDIISRVQRDPVFSQGHIARVEEPRPSQSAMTPRIPDCRAPGLASDPSACLISLIPQNRKGKRDLGRGNLLPKITRSASTSPRI